MDEREGEREREGEDELDEADVQWLLAAGFDTRSLSLSPSLSPDEEPSDLPAHLLDALLLRASGLPPTSPSLSLSLSAASASLSLSLSSRSPRELVSPAALQRLRDHLSA